ncbi:ABC transporter permease [Moorella sulfitireducens]|uniref:ABC transporter permease n=1 Tax=Neomoorella sulfitireducens TaxID=2972948 RepID=UPI0021AB9CC1|nr:ABC transporter permease [Moorella sulfitireducens]
MRPVLSWTEFLAVKGPGILSATWEHLMLSLGAVLLGTLIAVPLGIILARHERGASVVLGIASTIQTIPSLAFFGFVLPFLGIGVVPAMTVLFLYSLLPILRNTYTGIREVNPAYLEAGIGMGMNRRQLLTWIQFPLAFPVIMSGIRVSTVYIISWATLSALIGAGGLGDPILAGIHTYDAKLIIAGALPAAILALLVSWLLGLVEYAVTPRGLRQR